MVFLFHGFYRYRLVGKRCGDGTLGSVGSVGTATSWSNGQPTQVKSGSGQFLLQFARMCAHAAGSLRDVGISLFLSFGYIYISCTRHFYALLWNRVVCFLDILTCLILVYTSSSVEIAYFSDATGTGFYRVLDLRRQFFIRIEGKPLLQENHMLSMPLMSNSYIC